MAEFHESTFPCAEDLREAVIAEEDPQRALALAILYLGHEVHNLDEPILEAAGKIEMELNGSLHAIADAI